MGCGRDLVRTPLAGLLDGLAAWLAGWLLAGWMACWMAGCWRAGWMLGTVAASALSFACLAPRPDVVATMATAPPVTAAVASADFVHDIRCKHHSGLVAVLCQGVLGDRSAMTRCARSRGWTHRKGRSGNTNWWCPQCTAEYMSPDNLPQQPPEPEPCCIQNHGDRDRTWWEEQRRRHLPPMPVPRWAASPPAPPGASTPTPPSASTPAPPAPSAEAVRAMEERVESFQQQLQELMERVEGTETRGEQALRRDEQLLLRVAELEDQNDRNRPLVDRVDWLEWRVQELQNEVWP